MCPARRPGPDRDQPGDCISVTVQLRRLPRPSPSPEPTRCGASRSRSGRRSHSDSARARSRPGDRDRVSPRTVPGQPAPAPAQLPQSVPRDLRDHHPWWVVGPAGPARLPDPPPRQLRAVQPLSGDRQACRACARADAPIVIKHGCTLKVPSRTGRPDPSRKG